MYSTKKGQARARARGSIQTKPPLTLSANPDADEYNPDAAEYNPDANEYNPDVQRPTLDREGI